MVLGVTWVEYFACTIGYADDLKLLTQSVNALNILIDICKNYAAKYDVMFNAKKSLLIIYMHRGETS